MKQFDAWLFSYRKQDTIIGDFARLIALDFEYPEANEFISWEDYLIGVGASSTVMGMFHEAWILYTSDTSSITYPEDQNYTEENNLFDKNDDHWVIRRPLLPNYWGHTPNSVLIQVHYNLMSKSYRQQRLKDDIQMNISDLSIYLAGLSLCEAVEQFATYFKREFKYDFLQYTVDGHHRSGDKTTHPYLFFNGLDTINVGIRPVGGCTFYFKQELNKWILSWIWLHPFARRKGYLTKAWPYFKQRYQDFELEYPLSDAMKAFLKKSN